MNVNTSTVACMAGSLLAAATATADFVNVTVDLVDLGAPNGTTYRFYANFDEATDQILAVSGNDDVSPFEVTTSMTLRGPSLWTDISSVPTKVAPSSVVRANNSSSPFMRTAVATPSG